MRQSRRRVWHWRRPVLAICAAILSPIALLLPAIAIGADSAAAAPAAGYTVSLIPTTGEDAYAVAVDSVQDVTSSR
jgi:hypothetical protein